MQELGDTYLANLFSRIKSLRDDLTVEILEDELNKWKNESTYFNYHINILEYPEYNLFILYYNNDNNKKCYISQSLASQIKLGVFKYNSFEQILTFYNCSLYDNDAIDYISTNVINWDNNIIVTKLSLESQHICLFNDNNIWYITYPNKIIKIDDTTDIIANCLNSLIDNIDKFNSDYIYHILLKDKSLKKIGSNDVKSEITILWISDKMMNIIDNNILLPIPYEKKYYFSCLDELQTAIEIEYNNDIINKSLSFGGYHIKVISNDGIITNCILRSDLYKYILSVMPNNKNQHINYLELYQKNLLSDILPYIHKYPIDVIRRINMSIKILSKEILNIYHLTRKKQNSNLYDCLTQNYKKILYDLHKIYANQKYGEYIIKSTDILKEKKSISVDVVYNYIKNLQTSELLQIFSDRKIIMKNLDDISYSYDSILSVDNIDIITQIELMDVN